MSYLGTSLAAVAEPRPAATGTVPGWIVGLIRLVVTLWTVLGFIRPVLAGQFLDGNDDLVSVHGMNAAFVLLTALVMLVAAVLLWRPGHGAAWPVGASTLLLVLVLSSRSWEVPACWLCTCRWGCCCSDPRWRCSGGYGRRAFGSAGRAPGCRRDEPARAHRRAR